MREVPSRDMLRPARRGECNQTCRSPASPGSGTSVDSLRREWQAVRASGLVALIDIVLLVLAVLMAATDLTVLLFHLVFVSLTVGAFFWTFRGFVLRGVFWVALTSLVVL